MKRLVKWHRDFLNNIADMLGLSAYQIVWIAFIKGLVLGYLIGVYL